MSGLIDTTEMFLKAILEMREVGLAPRRSSLATRLGQSIPSVSQTVERLVREELVSLDAQRIVHFTQHGAELAEAVMRKHRVVEAFLFCVLDLPWTECHEEACRWEHVVSDDAERRMFEKLGDITTDPYGNPIPGLQALGRSVGIADPTKASLPHLLDGEPEAVRAELVAIGEPIQADLEQLRAFDALALRPGVVVLARTTNGGYEITINDSTLPISKEHADFITVREA